MEEKYYSLELSEIYDLLKTDKKSGLTQQEAENRLETNGPNELPKVSKGFIKIYLAPLFNWLIVIYLICALLMLIFIVLGEEGDLTIIYLTLGIVALNCLIAIFQQMRATKKLKALKELTAPVATVIRDGKKKDIPSKAIVKGDILVMNQGDKIPADSRIISSSNFEVNEASLTGESEPVKKSTSGEAIKSDELSIAERLNMVFYGTYITTGNGLAIVVKIGGDTEIGKISHGLEEAGTSDIPIRRKMNNFGKWLGLIIVALWMVILLFKWITTFSVNFAGSLNAALDLMPINLPLLTTIVLLTGVLAMARQGVIVRNIASVDSLGRASVVCTDKTGTLTKNQMSVQYLWVSGKEFRITGNGYEPEGQFFLLNNKNEQIAVHHMDEFPDLKRILISGFLNNNSALVKNEVTVSGKTIPNWNIIGSPTEGALMVLYQKGMGDYMLEDFEKLREYPFDSRIKRMSVAFKKDDTIYSFTKGASEVIIPLSSEILMDNQVIDFTDDLKQKVFDKVNEYAGKGYRILSLCEKRLDRIPDEGEDGRNYCESGLTYLGFVTILDPPREGVRDSVKQCHSAGVDVVMITGDSPTTARAIAKQIAIIEGDDEIVCEGKAIKEMIDKPEFEKIRVYARVSPEHKQDIIQKYKSMNKVVAMTGDGVNDTLALNMADAGLAMGITGTDVAKEASDMVISDDSFNSIVHGIHQGRGIFSKVRAVVFFYICINVFEGLVAFILAVILDFPWWVDPLSPYSRMWFFLSLTIHVFPGLILTFDTVSLDVMEEKPKDSEEILSRNNVYLMFAYGGLLAVSMILTYFIVLYGVYPVFPGNFEFGDFNGAYLYTTETAALVEDMDIQVAKALTMVMVTLFFCECFLVYQIRRPNKDIIRQFMEDSNKIMYLLIGFCFALFLLLMYFPGVQITLANWNINFAFVYLTGLDWLICFLISCITIVGFEVLKYLARQRDITF